MRRLLTATMFLAGVVTHPSGAQRPERATVIHDATVITMTGDSAAVASVVTQNGVITAIGARDVVVVPAGARVIEARGRFLMPGLTDGHVHLFGTNDLKLMLTQGITTALNMSGSPMHLGWRAALRAGTLVGPTLYTTGPQLKIDANPVLDVERTVTTTAEATRIVAAQAAAGYDFVKVWGRVDAPVYAAVLAAAKAHGIRVTGHIPPAVGLTGIIDAGQSSIAHIEEFYNKVFDGRVDDAGIAPLAHELAAAGIPVFTTLVTYEAITASLTDDGNALLSRSGRELLDPVRAMSWRPEANRLRQLASSGDAGEFGEALAFMKRIANALREAGVPLIAGTDAGEIPGLVPGFELHRELAALVSAGFSPEEALATATRNPGAFLGRAEPFGTIAVGSRADLLLLEADPRLDLANTRRIVGVMARGGYHDAVDLAELRAGLDASNALTGKLVEAAMGGGAASATARFDSLVAGGVSAAEFDEMPLVFLAYTFAERGDMQGGVQLLHLAVRAHPTSYFPRYMIGAALLGAGQQEAGRALLEEVLRLSPGHDGALSMLGKH